MGKQQQQQQQRNKDVLLKQRDGRTATTTTTKTTTTTTARNRNVNAKKNENEGIARGQQRSRRTRMANTTNGSKPRSRMQSRFGFGFGLSSRSLLLATIGIGIGIGTLLLALVDVTIPVPLAPMTTITMNANANANTRRILPPSFFVLGYIPMPPTRTRTTRTAAPIQDGTIRTQIQKRTRTQRQNQRPSGLPSTSTLSLSLSLGRLNAIEIPRAAATKATATTPTPPHALGMSKQQASGASSSSLSLGARIKRWRRFGLRLVTGYTHSRLDAGLSGPRWLSPHGDTITTDAAATGSPAKPTALPAWIFHLRPSVQLLVTLVFYLFHTAVLTQNSLPLPFQLIPNDRGNFQSIGLDSLAGMGTLAFYQYLRRRPSNYVDLEVTKSSQATSTSATGTGSESEPKTPGNSDNNDVDIDIEVDVDADADAGNNATNASTDATTAQTTTSVAPSYIYSSSGNTAAKKIVTTTTTTTTTTTAIKGSYLPDLFSAPHPNNMPWKGVWKSRYSRVSSLSALAVLTRAYFFTGRVSLFWEDTLYGMATHLDWMTVGMHRSLSVLLGHLSWVAMGAVILRTIPRPQPFFGEPRSQWFSSVYKSAAPKSKTKSKLNAGTPTTTTTTTTKATTTTRTVLDGNTNSTTLTPGQMLSSSSSSEQEEQSNEIITAPPSSSPSPSPSVSNNPQWIWWAIGGYFVSSWLFNVVDLINSYVFPLAILEQAEESSVVAKLVNPEGQDLLASLVGFIAPCLTAPWWEEILYRGFLLPTLVLSAPGRSYWWATFLSGVLFSIHHQSELAFLPLCVLGWTWAIVYTKSKNLWTTIVIHSMWNSRIFLGGWFGL